MEEDILLSPKLTTDWILGTLDLWLEYDLSSDSIMTRLDDGDDKSTVDAEIHATKMFRDFVLDEATCGKTDGDIVLSDFYYKMLHMYNNEFSKIMKQVYMSAMNLVSGIYEDWDLALQETELL